MHVQTDERWLPGLKTDLIQLCRERPSLYFVCVCVCMYACLVFMVWQAIVEQGVQHGDKWDRIERVPARPYKLDAAIWKKKRAKRIVADKGGSPTIGHWWLPFFLCSHCSMQADAQTRVQTWSHTYSFPYVHTHLPAHRITHSSITMYYLEAMAFLNHSMFL